MEKTRIVGRGERSGAGRAWRIGVVLLMAVCACGACKRRPPDAELQKAASSALASDEQLKGRSLEVSVKDGVATIEGVVMSEDARQEARRAVESVGGMKEVADHLKVAPPRVFTFAAGTDLRVQMTDGIDSSVVGAGQTFRATLASPLASGETVVAPEGVDAVVRLVQARQAGHMAGHSELTVELASLTCEGTAYEINSTTVSEAGASRGKQSARRITVAAGAGAVVGALIGGGKGAAIGAGIGAGAATAHQLATRGPAVKIPAGAKLDFELEQTLTLTLPPKI